MRRIGFSFTECNVYFELYTAVSPVVIIHGSRNQELEVRVAFLTVTLNNPLAELLLPVVGY